MAAPSAQTTPAWPASYYRLIDEPGAGRFGDRLMLCTIHDQRHIRHGRPGDEWCQSLEPHRRGPKPTRMHGAEHSPPRIVVVEPGDVMVELVGAILDRATKRPRELP
jgi:hypothetical protein